MLTKTGQEWMGMDGYYYKVSRKQFPVRRREEVPLARDELEPTWGWLCA